MNGAMSKADVWNAVAKHRSEIVGKLQSFTDDGVDVEGIYHDVAIHLTEQDTSKLIAKKLPGLLYWKTRNRCVDYLQVHGNDPKRRVPYDPDDPSEELEAVEAEAAKAAWEAAKADLDRELLLRRIPEALARTWRMHLIEGYTWPEIAARRGVTEWTARQDFQAATAAMTWIVEHEGQFAPREHVESPRHKAAREEIEWRCAQLRPAVTKPTTRIKKPDPRTFWYGTMTLKYFDWMKELEARIKRGERFPHANPWHVDLPAALDEMPLRSLDHKMYELSLMSEQLGFTPTLERKRRCRQVIQFADTAARKRALAKASTGYPMLPQPYYDPTVALAA
jgi:DNA-directed RNA polymerase specialized sigma24 family protein